MNRKNERYCFVRRCAKISNHTALRDDTNQIKKFDLLILNGRQQFEVEPEKF